VGLDPRLRSRGPRAHGPLPADEHGHPAPERGHRRAGRAGSEREHDAAGGAGFAGGERRESRCECGEDGGGYGV